MNDVVGSMSSEALTESLCCGLLRGEIQRWPFADENASMDAFVEQLLFHGVDMLVYERLSLLQSCPVLLRSKLREYAVSRAAWELRERNLTGTALAALADAGVQALVYKGTALAYSLYRNPVWRTRTDSDVLVQEDHLTLAMKILRSLGYRERTADDEMIFYKIQFTHSTVSGEEHHIDLHWQLNNAPALSGLFQFAELQQAGHSVDALGAGAQTVSLVHALLIACLHRGVHQQSAYTVNTLTRYTGDRLVWLYDMDQLARAFSPAQWQEFYRLAHAKGLAATCTESLLLAHRLFNTPLPTGWDAALHTAQRALPDSYLVARALQRGWLDFIASRGLQKKFEYCMQVLLPPAAYMQKKYAGAACTWLPWLYCRRALQGISRRAGARW